MVPGMGMRAVDFQTKGLIADVERRQWPVTVTTVDPGPDAYLDGSVEDGSWMASTGPGVAGASASGWPASAWAARASSAACAAPGLGRRPAAADAIPREHRTDRGGRAVGWTAALGRIRSRPGNAEQSFLAWLGTTPTRRCPGCWSGTRWMIASPPRLHAGGADPGGRDDHGAWSARLGELGALWRLMLDRDPFGRPLAATP